jgi:hypothetical protein
MMRRNIWSIGLIVSALSALLWTTAVAQLPCCEFHVRHKFKLCLNNCPFQLVQWHWFTQASVGNPPVTNTNASQAAYHPIPSNDIQCTTAVTAAATAPIATACTRFQVNWIPGTNCMQGIHEAFGSCLRQLSSALAPRRLPIPTSHSIVACRTAPGLYPVAACP